MAGRSLIIRIQSRTGEEKGRMKENGRKEDEDVWWSWVKRSRRKKERKKERKKREKRKEGDC